MMTMLIYWTLFSGEPEPKSVEDFLSQDELGVYLGIKVAKRQHEWLSGRLAAKQLLLQNLTNAGDLSLRSVSVKNDPNGAPYFAFSHHQRLPGCLSISHSHRLALCGLTFAEGVQIGFDLERIEPRFPGLAEDFFTPLEVQSLLSFEQSQQDLWITLIWSAKEAMLKALGMGLHLDTRSVEICLVPADCWETVAENIPGWRSLPVKYHGSEPGSWLVFWQKMDEFILTAAVLSNNSDLDVALIQQS